MMIEMSMSQCSEFKSLALHFVNAQSSSLWRLTLSMLRVQDSDVENRDEHDERDDHDEHDDHDDRDEHDEHDDSDDAVWHERQEIDKSGKKW